MSARRARSNTADNAELKRPKSGQPRKFDDKIAMMKQREAEDARAYAESMKIITQMQMAKLTHGGSMPVLTQTESAGGGGEGGGWLHPIADPYSNGGLLQRLPPPSMVHHMEAHQRLASMQSNHTNMQHPPGKEVQLSPRYHHSNLPSSESFLTNPLGRDTVERLLGNGATFTRHKSDSDLRQTLMLEEEASQGQQQQTLYPHTPSAPPPVSISPSETYPMPSTHWSHSSHFRASTGTTPLSVSHNTDRMHSAMAQAKAPLPACSARSGPYSPAPKQSQARLRKHVSTNSPPNHDQSLGRYPEAPPFPVPHQLSLSKGASSSLPDLTNADFSSGLPTPLDKDDSSMESVTGEDHLPVNIPDFAHYLPTRQVPQGQPKPPQISPYVGYLMPRPNALETTPPQGVGRQHLSAGSPLSPLATTRKSGNTRPTRSVTVSSFTELAEEGGPASVPMGSMDDSMLMELHHHTHSDSTREQPYSHSCDQATLRDQRLPEAVPAGRASNALPSNVQHHFFPEQIGIPSITPSGSGTTENFSLSRPASAAPAPLSASYNCRVPDKPSPSYSNPVPSMSYPGVGQVHPPPLRATLGNPLQQSSYTTDNIPSSTVPAVPLGKRLPPSYYEHQMKHCQPTAIIQERLTSISLHQDLTRSWSEENLFAKNPTAAQKEKGSPVHNPFMGTMGAASSVPCVRLDLPTDVLAMMGQGGAPGSPESPESTSTETPPSTLRYNPPPTLNLTGFYEWPLDPSRRESLGGQYRSLTDLTTAMGMDTGAAFPNQKAAVGTASGGLFHPNSLPCLQNELDDIDHIDGLIDQLGYPLMESLLKQDGINFDFGDVITDESYQEMDSSGQ